MTPAWTEFAATRMDGAGNSFFIIDERTTPAVLNGPRPPFVKRICQEIPGQTTDGVVFLQKDAELDFAWEFYNSDGSLAEMCGNAARCASLFCFQQDQNRSELQFRTSAGVIGARKLNTGRLEVQLPAEKILSEQKSLKLKSAIVTGFFINTGVPHFVLNAHPDAELAKEIRHHADFQKQGTNVTFVQAEAAEFYGQAVTFERGVEGFTLACGTGAVAAAAFLRHLRNEQGHKSEPRQKDEIEMPGGTLNVSWQQGQPCLEGPAEFHYTAHFSKEFL